MIAIWRAAFMGVSLFVAAELCAKIRLFTFQYNRPDFIEMQHRCLQKFLKEKDDYELIVISDATDPVYKKQIEEVCERLGITCVNFPQELHKSGALIDYVQGHKKWPGLDRFEEWKNGSVRHCQLVRYAIEKFCYGFDDIIGIFEGDLFLIRDLSIRELMQDCDIACATRFDTQGKGVEYIWIGLVFLNMNTMPHPRCLSFDIAHINGAFLDSGGRSHDYLVQHSSARIKNFPIVPIFDLPRGDDRQLYELGYTEEEVLFLSKTRHIVNNSKHTLLPEFHFNTHFLHQSQSRYSEDYDFVSKVFKDYLERITN